MLRSLSTAGLAIAAACAAWGQTPDTSLTFEVATIKPSAPPASMDGMRRTIRIGSQGGPGTSDPGQLTYSFANVRMLVMQAYSLKTYQVTGPEWLDSEHYDVVAKVPKGATKDDVKIMLQNLLKERFHLAFHNETKELPVFALVVAKNGPKMKESADQSDPNDKPAPPPTADGGPSAVPPPPGPPEMGKMRMGNDGMPVMPAGVSRPGNLSNMVAMTQAGARAKISGTQVTVTQLVGNLSNQVDRPLVDATGLTKRYDIALDFAPDVATMNAKMGMSGMMVGGGGRGPDGPGPGGPPAGDVQVADAASLPAALQSQLGLKLEQRKAPVEFLIVDKVDKAPTEN